jgi:hypothetical protein
MDKLTRNQAIAMVGINKIQELEALNCEPTSRAYDHADGEIEWSASLTTEFIPDGEPCTVTAYYYTDAADAAQVEALGGDWGGIDWEVSYYTIA